MMDRMITILRAAHCRSTHRFFVLDALPGVSTEPGQRLTSQLLKHYAPYLKGAKAPDKEFRDFRNHVVHVQDDHWGGAPKAAERWYQDLVAKIQQGNYAEAAYCAGVLSHYFTDPLMPLHTAQSEKESVVHRPLEWSVTKSYERILRRYRDGGYDVEFDLTHNDDWLGEAVIRGAEVSNRYYTELIDRYDLQRGCRQPEEGFDDPSIEILAGLFGVAIVGWANILERAAKDSGVDIPAAPLSLASLVASISMPVAWIVRRIESASEQKAVRALFEEYESTGRVVENLPAEVSSVREERQRDRVADSSDPAASPIPNLSAAPQTLASATPSMSRPQQPTTRDQSTQRVARAATTTAKPELPSLAMGDDLVDAPSIGPKTARRFAAIGITTVEQFLAASAEWMADQLQTRWIKPDTLRDWQDQARLVATVPGLCGYKSQLLVGVECRDDGALAAQNPARLHRQIEQFAKTRAGKRALRSSRVPDLDEVTLWVTNARRGQLKQAG